MTTEKHRAQMRDRYRRIRAIGICSRCRRALTTGSRCGACAELHNEPRRLSADPERAE